MDSKDEAFLKRLLSTFRVEAAEHLAAMSSCLLDLEKYPAADRQTELVERIFREAHSMKGAARSVNLKEIESSCQSLESVFAAIKKSGLVLTPGHFDVLHRAVDLLSSCLSTLKEGWSAEQKKTLKTLTGQLEEMSKGGRPPEPAVKQDAFTMPGTSPVVEQSAAVVVPAAAPETVRIPAEKLGAVLLQAEEFLSEKLAAGRRAAEIRELRVFIEQRDKKWGKLQPVLRAVGQALEKSGSTGLPDRQGGRIMKLLEVMEENADFIRSLRTRVAALEKSAAHDQRVAAMVDNLTETMKAVLMVPFSAVLELFPKLVRDLSHAQGKEAEFAVQGGDVEVDRRVLDEMKDPLIHLLRNCIDHGIEKPAAREKAGKPRSGSLSFSVSHAENKRVVLAISDDGTGIDFDKVRDAAVKTGVLPPEEAASLGDAETLQLIFQSGISTSPIITDLSGRGLGLAIVKEKVDRLNGTISCESHEGRGTTFRIVLPLTLTAFRGLAVRVDEHLFIVPTMNLDRTVRVARDEIRTVENSETISLGGRTIPLLPLHAVLELPQKEKKGGDDFLHAAVLRSAEKLVAFSVDGVLKEEEVLIKGLGPQLSRVRNVSGATVLGNGRVVPILNVSDLMKSAVRSGVSPVRTLAREEAAPVKKVLVVEDSITARTLLKNILESAGYEVRTAVDGVDAFALLKTEAADIVISDVDMPRMNGFDLTAKIRSDRKFADLPVVLVTALESRDDRERGIDVGASAYIVKSSFDQSNLLETIRRLI
jgi:two-component system chemotaxis sensor kinase CheA